jgi:exopolysaccharide biosynthesis polyprenyl glycosylphosphotransferase
VTLAAERGLGGPSHGDRRSRAAFPRRSWASPQPFVLRDTPFNDAVAVAGVRRWAEVAVTYQRRVVLLDALAAVAVGALFMGSLYGGDVETALLVCASALAFVVLVSLMRGYETKALGDGPTEFQALIRAGGTAMVLLMGLSYAFQAEISRALVFVGVPATVLLALVGRYAHRRFLHADRAQGSSMKPTLVVGDGESVARVVADLSRAPYHGYLVTGICLPSLDEDCPTPGVPLVGAVAVVDRAVEVVVVAGSHLSGEALRRLSWALDRAGAQLIVAPDLVEVTAPRLTLRPAAGLSLLEVEVGAPATRMLAKATLDRLLGSALLLAVAPLIAVAALAVRVTSPGPAFYRQTRVGVDGNPFTMWKLRSMYLDADARRDALLEQSDGSGVLFKMRKDPRVTPVGRVLRRYSLDELPQLLNVVLGDMSLVGPRPPLAEEVAAYADMVHRRLRVKPGLTGLWQVSGRSDLSWDEAVRLDLRYVDNWSVTMDLMILWKTVRAVATGSGAY